MNFYKKIFKSQKLRFKILSALRFISDESMLKLQYFIKCGRKLNLNNPQRYTEKIQWYKLNYRNPVMQQCCDKYAVREYVKLKGLEHILNDLYAVYDSPEHISFDTLPDEFVSKLSNGSSTNILVDNKLNHNLEHVKQRFRDFISQSSTSAGREWCYITDKTPVIVAERYMKDPDQNNMIYDYKFLCFNGVPHYVVLDTDRFSDHRRNIYDMSWNNLHISSDCPCSTSEYPRPDTMDEMIDIAKILSAGFPAVRIDLYSVQGKVYFGEMTFFPWSGYVIFNPDSFDYELGALFELPEKNN